MAPFPPSDETPAMVAADRVNFMGQQLEGIFWGAHVILYLLCVYQLTQPMTWRNHRKHHAVMLAFTTLLFVLGTLNFVGSTVGNMLLFVDNRFPGGPSAEAASDYFYSLPISIAAEAAFFFGSSATDGLLLYRTWLVWNRNRLIMIVPVLLWITSFIMSVMLLIQLCLPESTIAETLSYDFQLAYLSLTAALNVLLTLLIAGRLRAMCSKVRASLGAEHAKAYTSIAAMVVESSLPYTATLFAFIISTAVNNNPAQTVLIAIQAQMMAISPLLIIWRVAAGRAWAHDTLTNLSGPPSKRFRRSSDEVIMSTLAFTQTGTTAQAGSTYTITKAQDSDGL